MGIQRVRAALSGTAQPNCTQVTPEAISLAPGVTPTAIAAVGFLYSLAIGSNGDLYAWGDNNVGQLGDGTGVKKNSPEMITLAPDVTPTAIAAGGDDELRNRLQRCSLRLGIQPFSATSATALRPNATARR